MLRVRSYIRVLTWQRVVNWLRCEVNYALSRMGKVRVTHRPTFVSVEPANFCQLSCPECPVGMRQKDKSPLQLPPQGERETFFDAPRRGILSPSLFAKLLEENACYMHTVIFYFQGEPLLNKELPTLIRMAKERKLYTYLSTNLQALTPEMAHALIDAGIDHIVASIDGISEESYQAYRQGGKLAKALQGLRLLHEAKVAQKADTIIEWQCLRLRSNEHEWEEIRKQYKALGADCLTFKKAQFYDYEHGNSLMPTDEKYSRYRKQKDGRYVLTRSSRMGCKRLWAGCVMDVNGNILPCCFDKAGKYAFGSLHQQTFAEIWNSPKATAFRECVSKARHTIDICQNCTE